MRGRRHPVSDDYTPTVAEARALYEERTGHPEEHDRMIAEVERAAAEKAWSEGHDAALGNIQWPQERKSNPYRKGQSDE
jgi:hypothetical protein